MEPDPDEPQYPGEEDLEWLDESIKSNKPKGLYSKTTETARGIIPSERQCALFCGGKKCKYCSGDGWAPEETVIKGLYSHWITDNILAMARPSNVGIEKHNLVQSFKDAGINSIINLQIAGEHADCGPHKLDKSGFLYNQHTFMEEGVYFYNFGWQDYGVGSLSSILDMVKVMQFAVSQGRVAVHCHAGRGRTGVLIACYLVFTNRISGIEAIHYVREKRPNSIQTRQQMTVIQEFEQYLRPFRTVFAFRQKGSHEFSLQQFLNRQRHILHGYEARRLKHVPKIIYTVCERLLELANKGSSLQRQLDKASQQQSMNDLKHTFSVTSPTTQAENTKSIQQSSSKESILGNGKRRYKRSLAAVRDRYKSISMEDLDDNKFKSVLDASENCSVDSANSGIQMKSNCDNDNNDDDDDSIVYGNSSVYLKSAGNSSSRRQGSANSNSIGDGLRDSPSETGSSGRRQGSANSKCRVNGRTDSPVSVDQSASVNQSASGKTDCIDQQMKPDMSEDHVQAVAYALSAHKIHSYVRDRTRQLQQDLNDTDTAWTLICTEGDPHVLGLLLWDWLDHLKEPVLRVQDLYVLLQWIEEPAVGLHKVEKGTKHTIEYLINVISKLKPLKVQTLVNVYEKLLSHLTHQWVSYDTDNGYDSWAQASHSSKTSEEKEHWHDMRTTEAEKLFCFFHNLQDELGTRHQSTTSRQRECRD